MQFTLHIANSNSFQSRNLEFESSPENNFIYQNCNKRVEIKSFHKNNYSKHLKNNLSSKDYRNDYDTSNNSNNPHPTLLVNCELDFTEC